MPALDLPPPTLNTLLVTYPIEPPHIHVLDRLRKVFKVSLGPVDRQIAGPGLTRWYGPAESVCLPGRGWQRDSWPIPSRAAPARGVRRGRRHPGVCGAREPALVRAGKSTTEAVRVGLVLWLIGLWTGGVRRLRSSNCGRRLDRERTTSPTRLTLTRSRMTTHLFCPTWLDCTLFQSGSTVSHLPGFGSNQAYVKLILLWCLQ
jgi:hypothetical protein